jgi:hypothetical protein
MQLTPEEVATLKALAAAAPALEALLGAPAPAARTDRRDYESDDEFLRSQIAGGGDHFSNLQGRIENAWRR